jgi:hypothetical protein
LFVKFIKEPPKIDNNINKTPKIEIHISSVNRDNILKAKELKAKKLKVKKAKELKAKKLKVKKAKELKAKKLKVKKAKELKAKKLKVKKAKELKAKKLKVKKAKELKAKKELQYVLFNHLNLDNVDFNLTKYLTIKYLEIEVENIKGVLKYKILTKKVPKDIQEQLLEIMKIKTASWTKKNINKNFGKILIKIELRQ